MKKTLMTLAALAMASVASADLVGEWNFNDGVTATVSPSAVTTSTAGSPTTTAASLAADAEVGDGTYWTKASLGTALTITGNDDWVKMTGYDETYANTIVMNGSFTVASYVNFSAGFSDIAAIFGTGGGTGSGLAVGIMATTDGYSFDLLKKNIAHVQTSTIEGLTADTWHHVALSYSYDAETEKGTATWYLNGSEAATQVFTSTSADSYTNLTWTDCGYAGAAIGSTSVDAGTGFDGTLMLDRVQVYNTALDAAAIRKGAGLVPEPTTATLSLLALAGLAARRRRK